MIRQQVIIQRYELLFRPHENPNKERKNQMTRTQHSHCITRDSVNYTIDIHITSGMAQVVVHGNLT
jgi:hypothetical protein